MSSPSEKGLCEVQAGAGPHVARESYRQLDAAAIKVIDRAVIPLAGKGTRLRPMTCVLPKALFPIVDRQGGVRTVLDKLLEEVYEAGINHVCLVISPDQSNLLEEYLAAAQEEPEAMLPSKITFVEQRKPRGFGHAVLQARESVDGQPFVLMLGDHLHVAKPGSASCVRQVVQAFGQTEIKAMVGVHAVDEGLIHTVGVATGTPVGKRLFKCTDFVEKPDLQVARQRLTAPQLTAGKYLGHCGIYVFDDGIFECLEQESHWVGTRNREIELAAAQRRLLETYPESYYLYWIDGKAWDMGTPQGYRETFAVMSGLSEPDWL